MAAALRESRSRVSELGAWECERERDREDEKRRERRVRERENDASLVPSASRSHLDEKPRPTEAEVAELRAGLRAELTPPPPPSTSPSAAAGTITLMYSTGWSEAFCHYSRDGRAWTAVPGCKLGAPGAGGGGGSGDRELRIEGARRLDFVMTDGHGNWDTPVPSYASSNGSGNSSDGGGGGSDSDGGGGSSSASRGRASKRNHYSIEEPGTWRLKSGKLTRID
jgi:hypothetical protein